MRMYRQYGVRLELTFARRHALKPLVVNVFVAGTSAVLKPSTARSTATDLAGFLEHVAFGACLGFSNRWRDGWRAG